MGNYKIAYRTVYDYQAKYAPFPANDAEWRKAGEEMTEISRQGNDNKFLDELLIAVYLEFCRTEQQQRAAQ